jgi:hypothetical protein
MRIRENLGGLIAATSRASVSPTAKPQIGKVFGIITTKDTPTRDLFNKYGGFSGIGTIFYLDYDQSKNIDKADLRICKVAKPFQTNTQNYPLIGELVHLIDAPSPDSQINNTSSQRYYTGVINLWNNTQQNAPSGNSLGKTFIEGSDIRNLLSFEGDTIYQGRKGNGIRFGSTVKFHADTNEWSRIGNDGDPITIMVNGYVTTDTGSLSPNIEEINKELSSIYLTSTQNIPLLPDKNNILNPITQPLTPNKYSFPQVIINSDRITLNSKKDEVMIFAKTNVEINTQNAINLNADGWIHINSPNIILGPAISSSDNEGGVYQFTDQPMLLGGKTQALLLDLMSELSSLAASLTSAVSAPPGAPLVDLNAAGASLGEKLSDLIPRLGEITSNTNYVS